MEEHLKLNYTDQMKLDGFKWFNPEEEPKAIVVMFHGMAEHAARYAWFGEELAKHGYVSFCFSYMGHGYSDRYDDRLGYLPQDDYIDEINNNQIFVIREAKKMYPSLPLFIFAHSMGSMSSQRLIQKYPNEFDKVILCGTDYGNAKYNLMIMLTKHYIKKNGAGSYNKLINSLGTGMFDKKFKKERERLGWLSVNKENIERYEADPLCGYDYTVGYYNSLSKALRTAAKKENISLVKGKPVLFICGVDDPVTNFSKAPKKLNKIYNDCGALSELVIIDNARHEILNESEEIRNKAFTAIVNFLDK